MQFNKSQKGVDMDYSDGTITVSTEDVGNILLTSNFWQCGKCGNYYRNLQHTCPDCLININDCPDGQVLEIAKEGDAIATEAELKLYDSALDDWFGAHPDMARPGFVGRLVFSLNLDEQDHVEYMMSRKHKNKEQIWPTRASAVSYFRTVEHLAWDDIEHIFWFDCQECRRRNLRTGKLSV
jgi:hypothetical protein